MLPPPTMIKVNKCWVRGSTGWLLYRQGMAGLALCDIGIEIRRREPHERAALGRDPKAAAVNDQQALVFEGAQRFDLIGKTVIAAATDGGKGDLEIAHQPFDDRPTDAIVLGQRDAPHG